MMKKRSIFLCENKNTVHRVYADETVARLVDLAGLDPMPYSLADLRNAPEDFAATEYVFSTWGMPVMTEEEIRTLLPNLVAVFYGAGTVQAFARPFLSCGVRVFSAWAANAVPVAEYAVAQILLANKGFFRSAIRQSRGDVDGARKLAAGYPGNCGAAVGIIGVGMIGSMVAERLKNYRLEVLAFDPFLPEERAKELGVTLCTLEELFSRSQVVTNHLANNPQTQGMLNYAHFSRMRPYATFINTGRGAQVVEDDLVRILTEREDLTAVLDVTMPEPPVAGHPFYSLENCVLTPHIAGSSGDEVHRMAEYMAEQAENLLAGRPTRYEVTEKMLATMA